MIYFIPWVLLLSVCVLAIPVAAMTDKRKRQSLVPDAGEEPSQDADLGDAVSQDGLEDSGFGGESGFSDADNADAQIEGFN